MNLKEAFRFQNKLQTVLETATRVLRDDQNVTKTTSTYLRKKVMAEAEDETVELAPSTDYADRITELASFSMFILEEKEQLFQAIRKAKSAQAFDIDSEISLNWVNPKFCVKSKWCCRTGQNNMVGEDGAAGLPCRQYKQEAERMSRAAALADVHRSAAAAARRPLTCGPVSAIRAFDQRRRWPFERGSGSNPAAVRSISW